MNNWSVYCHINKTNNKKYVGITEQKVENRWRNGNGYKNGYFKNAIKKYGWNNFEHIVLKDNLSQYEAEELEIYYISIWNLTDKSFGYNLCNGGNTSDGYKHTNESKEKMRLSHIGLSSGSKNPMYCKCHTEEVKKEISNHNKNYYKNKENHPLYQKYGEANPNYGKSRNYEQKQKISNALKGRTFTEEHKQNLSNALKGRKISDEQKKTVGKKLSGGNNGMAIRIIINLNNVVYNFDTKQEALKFLQEQGITTKSNNNYNGKIIGIGTFNNIINQNINYTDTNGNTMTIKSEKRFFAQIK